MKKDIDMKNVIKLLEKMGKNVSMLDSVILEKTIAEAGLTPELSAAVKAGDVRQVETLLGKNGDLFSAIKVPYGIGKEEEYELYKPLQLAK